LFFFSISKQHLKRADALISKRKNHEKESTAHHLTAMSIEFASLATGHSSAEEMVQL
jgi:hypothetical protein